MRLWFPIQRLVCYCRGHRQLTACAAYASQFPGGRIRELHYCLACNGVVWVERPPASIESSADDRVWVGQ